MKRGTIGFTGSLATVLFSWTAFMMISARPVHADRVSLPLPAADAQEGAPASRPQPLELLIHAWTSAGHIDVLTSDLSETTPWEIYMLSVTMEESPTKDHNDPMKSPEANIVHGYRFTEADDSLWHQVNAINSQGDIRVNHPFGALKMRILTKNRNTIDVTDNAMSTLYLDNDLLDYYDRIYLHSSQTAMSHAISNPTSGLDF